jgi:hypothetical protein
MILVGTTVTTFGVRGPIMLPPPEDRLVVRVTSFTPRVTGAENAATNVTTELAETLKEKVRQEGLRRFKVPIVIDDPEEEGLSLRGLVRRSAHIELSGSVSKFENQQISARFDLRVRK